MKNNIIIFKGIKFYNHQFKHILKIIDKGGYLVAPAASALSNIYNNNKYYNSLKKADVAILDSGFFCILLRIFKNVKVKKLSGYLFLKNFLNLKFNSKEKFLTIDPNSIESKCNLDYLKRKKILKVKSYIAPLYNNRTQDKKLIKLINEFKPKYILINLGGGTQELLALYIKKKIKFKISTICTGAAISFMTKRQAPINDFIDKFYLGWFLRVIYNPSKYFIRIVKSFYLILFFFKN